MKIHRRAMNTSDSGLISEKYDHVISVTMGKCVKDLYRIRVI